MAISRASADIIPTSFATVSLGTSDDLLEDKLKAISAGGFNAIELGFPDLLSFASSYHGEDVKQDDYDRLCSAGNEVKKLCEKHNLGIMMLQPFSNFEGWPSGSQERDDAFSRARGWIRIMQAVGTDMLQVGSSDSVNITSSFDSLASDLRELADLLATHSYKLAYENWCWATHAPTWREVWAIVEKVDRPNIGLCLDTFQTAGGEWGDPTTTSGQIETAIPAILDIEFSTSLRELSQNVPPEKIYLLQISDAYKPPKPFSDEPDEQGLRPRGRWSHDFRPYPYNGGYLPVMEVARAVLGTGFRGWFSVEVFDGGSDGKAGMKQYDFEEFTKGAMASCKKLLDECSDSP